MKPTRRPANPCFSPGPCAKHPGWSPAVLAGAPLGRSHRATPSKAKLKEVIDRSRALLNVPKDWRIGIVPASDTGAVELALWSLLGPRGVDLLTWESFGEGWVSDVQKELKLKDNRVIKAPYGALPDLTTVDFARDVVFVWNGTTSGVRVPDGAWIRDDREGLTICDATSAAFAYDLPWSKLDATTYSWQKVMGGEAGFGMLILSPRAVARLESHTPSWPIPKIFRLTKGGKLNEGIFEGEVINTISMLCVEDALDALKWMDSIGGAAAVRARTLANYRAIERWVSQAPWIDFLASDPRVRSLTSVCLKVVDPWFIALDEKGRAEAMKKLVALVEKEGAGYDFGAYREAPPGLRLWAGTTVEAADLEAVFPWLDWAFESVKSA
ncbi:MAG: phosphoserine transaminase [Alphaproteobacteria bacterium]|nr:phosphoserine transaminase [Alphaproteobacteria bacterium]